MRAMEELEIEKDKNSLGFALKSKKQYKKYIAVSQLFNF